MTPLEITLAVAAGVLFAAAAWLLGERFRLKAERDVARARLGDREEGQVRFQALASDALRTANAEFLQLAQETMAAREGRTLAEVERRRVAVDELVLPIREALRKTAAEIEKVERGHFTLAEQVRAMSSSNQGLREETRRLSEALRRPNVRGRYGEVQLERVVELAGMRSYCDFQTQVSVAEGRYRPDLVVRLPNGRVLAIDAKVPIDSYLDAFEKQSPEEREAMLERFARDVLAQARRLAKKEYWEHLETSPELVVMFIPGDQLVDAALARQPKLIELAAQMNLVIASPSTLIGLLHAVHVGWRERNLSEQAKELFQLGRELHDRAATALGHADKVGESLQRAKESYNKFIASVETRLVPTLRKFEESGARSSKELVDPRRVEGDARELQLPADPDQLTPFQPEASEPAATTEEDGS